MEIFDTIVIGGGPAGYTAALYAVRAGLRTVLLEKLIPGGQMALTNLIENYPGFPEGVDGFSLAQQMADGAHNAGVESRFTEVIAVDFQPSLKAVHTTEGTLYSKTVIVATGAGPRPLGIEEEAELIGKGVSYCAHCDGMFFRGRTVAVVGGGNSAVSDALILSRICKKVILIHRRDQLRATRVYHEPLSIMPNVEMKMNSTVTKLVHDGSLTGIVLHNTVTGEAETISVDALFISIGRKPATQIFAGQLELDGDGYIVSDESTLTSVPGVFAAGDVRTTSLRQIVTAVADGARAAEMAAQYHAEMLSENKD